MHVCIVQPWMDYLGGAQILALDMANEFKKQGHKVSMITTKFDKSKFQKANFDIYEVGYNKFLNNTIGRFLPQMESSLLFVLNRIKKKIKELKPDKIIVKNFPTAWITGRNIYWYCEEPSFAVYGPLVNSIEYSVNSSGGFKFNLLKRLIAIYDKFIVNQLKTKIIVNSKRAGYLVKKIYHKDSIVINPCVNIAYYKSIKFNTKKIKKFLKYKFNFLLISRLSKCKNSEIALKALKELQKKHKEVGLIIVGKGPEENFLKKLTKHYNINAIFTGFISEEDKINLIKASDVVVYPPLQEPFGLVPIEAMICGKPVIAINEWGPTETIIHNKTGLLVNNNVQEFADAMDYLINNPQVRKKMGIAGRKRVEKEFDISIMIKKLVKVMEDN